MKQRTTTLAAVTCAVLATLSINPIACATTIANKTTKTKVFKIKQIEKLLNFSNSAALTSFKTLYGTSTALIPKSLVRDQQQTSNDTTILNQVPGVSAVSTNTTGTRPHISIRGFTQTQIGFTYDNIPITDGLDGGLTGGNSNYATLYNLVPVTLGETDGLQVYYGSPPPFVNGIGTLAGNINYLPRMPSNKPKDSVTMGYGSFGTINYGATINTGMSKSYGKLLVRFMSRQTKNYYSGTPDSEYSYYASYVFPTVTPLSRWSAIFFLNKTHGFVPALMPVALLSKYGNSYQWPHSFTYDNSKAESMTAILQNKTLLSDNLALGTKVFYRLNSYEHVSYANPNVSSVYQNDTAGYNPVGTVCQANGGTSAACLAQTNGGTFYHHYVDVKSSFGITSNLHYVSQKLTARAGGMALVTIMGPNYKTAGSTPNDLSLVQGYNDYFNQRATRVYSKLFAQAGYKLDRYLKLTGGLTYVNVTTNQSDTPGYFFAVGGTSGRTYDNISPYLSVTAYPFKHANIYADYGTSYKYPNFSTFYESVGNATATTPPTPIITLPEKVSTIQLGFNYSTEDLSAMLSVYRSDFSNTFTSATTTDGQDYEYNLGSSVYSGMNIAVAYQPIKRIKLYANYSLQKANYATTIDNSQYGVQVFSGEPRPNTPTYLANIGADMLFYGTHFNAFYNFVGPEYIQASTGGPTHLSTPSFSQLNLSISHRFLVNSNSVHSLTASLNIVNLLNSHALVLQKLWPYINGSGNYLEGEPMPPLSIFGSLTLSF